MRKIAPTVSVIMPCLNEEGSVGRCVESATKSLKEPKLLKDLKLKKLDWEIIIVDNGSGDRSIEEARKAGARVIYEKSRGYGNALLRGIKEAKGEIVVMGDSDGSYDFGEIGNLIKPILSVEVGKISWAGPAARQPQQVLGEKSCALVRAPRLASPAYNNVDIIIGSRLRGEIEKGAMPFLNRYLGTPILNFFLRLFYGIKLSDSQSGFRAFRREAFIKLNLKSGGMEFASEMLVRAKQNNLLISEVPITYRRRVGRSKLSPVRDAWRHIRFMLFFSPTWLFLVPGGTIGLIGLLSFIRLSFGPVFLFGRYFDIHSMIVASFIATLGFQISFLGLFAKTYAFLYLEQRDSLIEKLIRWFTLERGLIIGGVFGFWGVLGFLGIFGSWVRGGFGELFMVREVLFSITILSIAVQMFFGSFLFALLGSRWER